MLGLFYMHKDCGLQLTALSMRIKAEGGSCHDAFAIVQVYAD